MRANGFLSQAKKNGTAAPMISPHPQAPKTNYSAVFYPDGKLIPNEIASLIVALGKKLQLPMVMLLQDGQDEWGQLSDEVWEKFYQNANRLPKTPVALIIDSPGGYAKAAYRLAAMLRDHCGGFVAVVPRYAKSAATLLALGADLIVMGRDAELGPLDAQVMDMDREQRLSALEVTQSLERLNSAAMQAVDEQMIFWSYRSGKKLDTLLPITMRFVAEMMRPLFDKIETVQYTQYARVLKVAQEYAMRLLLPRDKPEASRSDIQTAEDTARVLTEMYPEHGFAIRIAEAKRIGLRIADTDDDISSIIEPLARKLGTCTFLGPILTGNTNAPSQSSDTGKHGTAGRRRRNGNRNVQARQANRMGPDDNQRA
jgi:hypothetical protein